jgi:hypothetical protein
VIALIEHTPGPVSGLPTIPVANGDVSAVTTEQGTFALVRAEEHLPGEPNTAAPYIELPPLVSTAWMSAMREFHGWLWPQTPSHTSTTETFTFTADPSGSGLHSTVIYEPANHTASRSSIPYTEPTKELNEEDLKHYARLAG